MLPHAGKGEFPVQEVFARGQCAAFVQQAVDANIGGGIAPLGAAGRQQRNQVAAVATGDQV